MVGPASQPVNAYGANSFGALTFDRLRPMSFLMRLIQVQDQAIQARMALIVGANVFDRLFAGVRFDELDGPLLYVYAKDEEIAAEIEDALHISIISSQIIGQEVEVVVVMPNVLQ